MKVVARRERYEQDMYGFRYIDLFPLDKLPLKEKAILVYKKGSFGEWKFERGKYCCSGAERYVKFKGIWLGVKDDKIPCGCITIPDRDCDTKDIHIDHCPFCGEKIEVVEEE